MSDVPAGTSPLLAVPGAVPLADAAVPPDAAVPWHYGDPLREQRMLAAGRAVTDLSHRGVVRVTGPDRLTWLHSLTTQHLTGLAPGVPAEALVLTPHGHVEHALHLVDDGASTWITVEPGTVTELVGWLDRMRFLLRVEVTDVTSAWAVVGLAAGPGDPLPGGLLPPADLTSPAPPSWQDPWPAVSPGSVSYSGIPDGDHPGHARPWREVLIPRDELTDRLAGVLLAGSWASEALRVEAWRPRLGAETDHRTIPHEVDWLRTAVHLAKGCYRGQETVARVHNLGRPPRRLVMLHLDGSEDTLPGARDAVLLGDRPVGFVTTAARHHELGPVALAMVRRSVPVGAPLLVSGLAAAQEIVVRP
ncbi:MAG: tRNA-modifying protein YgfZ [Actinomycetota bacterium]|nr:tRNA-modifying protein YgfZ [Actinomycetota bacterium]